MTPVRSASHSSRLAYKPGLAEPPGERAEVIERQRTGCLGSCPAYALSLFADGGPDLRSLGCQVSPVRRS